jgi:hypothetical protein
VYDGEEEEKCEGAKDDGSLKGLHVGLLKIVVVWWFELFSCC